MAEMHPTLFNLKRAYLAARNALEFELKDSALTVAQVDIVKLLMEPKGRDQRALQEALGVASATLTRLLAGMEDQGLVVRARSPTDARAKVVRATAKARRAVDNITETRQVDFLERLLRGFSKQERATLDDMLTRIAVNMGDVDG